MADKKDIDKKDVDKIVKEVSQEMKDKGLEVNPNEVRLLVSDQLHEYGEGLD